MIYLFVSCRFPMSNLLIGALCRRERTCVKLFGALVSLFTLLKHFFTRIREDFERRVLIILALDRGKLVSLLS